MSAAALRMPGDAAAIVLGAAVLAWPAFVNGYPLVFSDTGGFLHQTLGPLMLWDKPYVYGPFLHLFHWRVSLWGPLAAQAAIVSHLLWLTQRCIAGAASPRRHLAVTAFVALRPGAETEAGPLIAACRAALSPYKAPKEVRFVAALPRNSLGKVLRRQLRDEGGDSRAPRPGP